MGDRKLEGALRNRMILIKVEESAQDSKWIPSSDCEMVYRDGMRGVNRMDAKNFDERKGRRRY